MNVALNGFGRIGRAIYRINQKKQSCNIVAINDINPDLNNIAYLLRYDSTFGRFDGTVQVNEPYLIVNGQSIRVLNCARIQDAPWESLDVDLIVDASGLHDNVLAAPALIKRGVKKFIVTQSPDEVDHTLVFGANHQSYRP